MSIIFSYGVLRRRCLYPATLRGYEKFFVPETKHPLIRKKEGSIVNGMIRRDITDKELKQFDKYECESGLWKREEVVVQTGKKREEKAFVYVAIKEYRETEEFSVSKEITQLKKKQYEIQVSLMIINEQINKIIKLNNQTYTKIDQIQAIEINKGLK